MADNISKALAAVAIVSAPVAVESGAGSVLSHEFHRKFGYMVEDFRNNASENRIYAGMYLGKKEEKHNSYIVVSAADKEGEGKGVITEDEVYALDFYTREADGKVSLTSIRKEQNNDYIVRKYTTADLHPSDDLNSEQYLDENIWKKEIEYTTSGNLLSIKQLGDDRPGWFSVIESKDDIIVGETVEAKQADKPANYVIHNWKTKPTLS